MEKLENLKKQSVEARRELIEKGAACYPEALVALNEFCGEIWRRLAEVLVGRLPVLNIVLGLNITQDKIGREAWPKIGTAAQGFAGNWAWLCVRLNLSEQNLNSVYVGLYWEQEEIQEARPICAQAGISVNSKAALEKAWPKFQSSQAVKYEEGGDRDIYYSSQVPDGMMNEFQGVVEKKLDDLIQALKDAEGLNAFRT